MEEVMAMAPDADDAQFLKKITEKAKGSADENENCFRMDLTRSLTHLKTFSIFTN
jgi:hypothetical protein